MTRQWRLNTAMDANDLATLFAPDLRLDGEAHTRQSLTVLDGFHWPIWHAGGLLTRDADGTLHWHGEAAPRQAPVAPRARYWWQVPAGTLQKRLKASLGLWSFNPVAELDLKCQQFALRNDDDKIVVRGECLSAAGQPPLLTLRCLRGYQDEFTAACARLSEVAENASQELALRDLVQASVADIPAPQTKPVFGITTDMPAQTCCRQMLHHMLEHARIYEAGICADTDTEFLHQYRVSLRKARSLLTLMKSCFAANEFQALKKVLGDLARPTGPTRDLDVFQLDHPGYAAMLPPELRAGFDSLGRTSERARQSEQQKLRRWLRSKRYRQTMAKALELLDAPGDRSPKKAQAPIGRLVNKKALARYHKIVSLGQAIDARTPDEDVHQLRIECKKLRYLMEFFAELYPDDALKPLLGALKGLQDILGKFNDFCVQKDDMLAQLTAPEVKPELAAAIGGLVALLHQQQLAARRKVQAAFAEFARDEIAAQFEQQFAAAEAP